MQVSVSELKANTGKFIDLAQIQDIFITKNGKQVAKIVGIKVDRVAAMKSTFGTISIDTIYEKVKEERLFTRHDKQ